MAGFRAWLPRSSKNRDSVLKTLAMTEDEIRAWAKEPAAAGEERWVARAAIQPRCHHDGVMGGGVTGSNAASAMAAGKTNEERRAWAEESDDAAIKETRIATFFEQEGSFAETVWRGADGEVRYTLTNASNGARRTGSDRDSVVMTLKMSVDEVRAWVEDPKAVKEQRAASTLVQKDSYLETVWRGTDGQVRYSLTEAANGSRRVCRDRESAQKTLKMKFDDLRAWAEATDDKAVKEERSATFFVQEGAHLETIWHSADGQARYTLTDPSNGAHCTSKDRASALKVLKLPFGETRAWAAADDEKSAKENRSASFFNQEGGFLEVVWHAPDGQARFTLTDPTTGGRRTSKDRASALRDLKLPPDQARAWATGGDDKALKEDRAATILVRDESFSELISRGLAQQPEEPPLQP